MEAVMTPSRISAQPTLVFQGRRNNNLQVAEYNKKPVLYSRLTEYKPSEAYRNKVKQLQQVAQITHREQLKVKRELQKVYAREVATPLFLYRLIEYMHERSIATAAK